MVAKVVNINSQMNRALTKVLGEIQAGMSFASIGERFSKADITELPEDDTVIKISIGKLGEDAISQQTIDEEVKERFALYCRRYSITAMVTACEVYMQTMLLLTELVLLYREKKEISYEDFELLKKNWRDQLWSLGGLGLLEKCISLLENKVEGMNNRKYFADTNKIRRCITHRGGVVSVQDIDKSGTLNVMLLKPELFTNEGVVEKLPLNMEKGGLLGLRSVEDTLTWNLGQSIEPTIQLCQNIGWSLIQFCNEVHKKLGQSIINVNNFNPETPLVQAQ